MIWLDNCTRERPAVEIENLLVCQVLDRAAEERELPHNRPDLCPGPAVCGVCVESRGDAGVSNVSTGILEQRMQRPCLAPNLISAGNQRQKMTRNSHSSWHGERMHVARVGIVSDDAFLVLGLQRYER
jgi:hypothetical protein